MEATASAHRAGSTLPLEGQEVKDGTQGLTRPLRLMRRRLLVIIPYAHTRQDGVEDRLGWGDNRRFYRAIINGERVIDDLAIFCVLHHRRFDDWTRARMREFSGPTALET